MKTPKKRIREYLKVVREEDRKRELNDCPIEKVRTQVQHTSKGEENRPRDPRLLLLGFNLTKEKNKTKPSYFENYKG